MDGGHGREQFRFGLQSVTFRRNSLGMTFAIQHSDLRDLYDKVVAGERLSDADALRLFESKDINAVGAIADFARQRKVGNRASYILNRYLNYSNY